MEGVMHHRQMLPVGLVLLLMSGCHCFGPSCPDAPAPAPAPPVSVTGFVAHPVQLAVPPEGLTLGKAVALAGGVQSAKDAEIDPITTFVTLTRADATYHFPVQLVEQDLAGRVLLRPADRVLVQPWYKTELSRGLKKYADETIEYRVAMDLREPTQYDFDSVLNWFLAALKARNKLLPDAKTIDQAKRSMNKTDTSTAAMHLGGMLLRLMPNDLMRKDFNKDTAIHFFKAKDEEAFRAWAKDVFVKAAIKSLEKTDSPTRQPPKDHWGHDWDYLGALYRNLKDLTVPFTFLDERGLVRLPEKLTHVDMSPATPFHPNLGALQTGIGSTFSDEAIFRLRRRISDHDVEFVLIRKLGQNPATNKLPSAAELLYNTLIFAGDEVEVQPLAQVPVVTASLLAPMLHRRLTPPAQPPRSRLPLGLSGQLRLCDGVCPAPLSNEK